MSAAISVKTCNAKRGDLEWAIGGLTPLTTIDYPDHLACVIYTQGCPLRCGYCQNSDLIPLRRESAQPSDWRWNRVIDFLTQRQGLLEAVVISGGEPLIQPGLQRMVQQIKAMEFKVGLHTAGVNAAALSSVIEELDWIGLDIKAAPDNYARVTGRNNLWPQVSQCLQRLLQSGKTFECRTTVDWRYHSSAELTAVAQFLSEQGVRQYALQLNHGIGCLDPALCYPVVQPPEVISQLQLQLAPLFSRFSLRV